MSRNARIAGSSSRARRQLISTRCQQENVQLVFIESVCVDPVIIELNIRNTISSPECARVVACELDSGSCLCSPAI
jgi:hypothetical protein